MLRVSRFKRLSKTGIILKDFLQKDYTAIGHFKNKTSRSIFQRCFALFLDKDAKWLTVKWNVGFNFHQPAKAARQKAPLKRDWLSHIQNTKCLGKVLAQTQFLHVQNNDCIDFRVTEFAAQNVFTFEEAK